ncbi:MAG TPA: exonuclease domain-containing protein [Gammaproteobacteria bacterium]|nr:exonuclease domain-containing protein [Gammaproteobacteria bacterium]
MKWARELNGLLPVVVDLETSGLDYHQHAILEMACIFVDCGQRLSLSEIVFHEHVTPFEGAKTDPQAMEVNRIPLKHPFRFAKSEKETLTSLNELLEKQLKEQKCSRVILVGHNAHFDLSFLNAAYHRTGIKSFFHHFCVLDTVTLSAAFLGETVLAKALYKSKIGFDPELAHGALYDAKQTGKLFCYLMNSVRTDPKPSSKGGV